MYLLWPRCHNLKVSQFIQGLPCKTPLRNHSKQAMLLPSTQSGPNPWTVLIPKMPHLTKWKQDTDLALSWGAKRESIFHPAFPSIKNHKILVWIGSNRRDFRDVGTPKRLRQKEQKQRQNGIKKVPPTRLNHRPRHILFLNKEGSAICDWFLELFSERRVFPCQDSTVLNSSSLESAIKKERM